MQVPEEWNSKYLKDICEIAYGKDQKEVVCPSGQYDILGTGGKMGKSSKFLYDKPSVLIGRKGTINNPQYMEKPFWTVDTLFYTRANFKTIGSFLLKFNFSRVKTIFTRPMRFFLENSAKILIFAC